MKLLLRLSILLLSISGFSQASKDVQVEYQLFSNTSWPMKMFTTLYVSGNTAIYRERFNTKEPWLERSTPEILAQQKKFASDVVLEDTYQMTDRNKKEVLFYDYVMSKKFLVRDLCPDIQWQITDETKTVAGLTCIKAVGDFRGRQWIAWFAPEIPLAFGPWKLQGLPGIILEAYDSTEKYAIKAYKVEYKKSEFAGVDFTKLVAVDNNKPISYQQFVQDNDEGLDNLFANTDHQKEADAAGIKVTNITVGKPVTVREGFELKYEWEK
ncbi:MAG: hypothetical protein DI539_02740 [Flavobacterium psychrophilum]|nr:MAG: hypothetical protein DI539_02740 [Flavobacterium psychrophilum]